MKILVVYYSMSGNTKKVGDMIAEELKCDVEEIVDLENRPGALGWIKAAHEQLLKKASKIRPAQKSPADYDLVIIGTPVWGMTVTPPVRSYIEENKDRLKKVAFFCTRGTKGDGPTFKEMERISGKAPVRTLCIPAKELSDVNHMEKIKKFTGEITG